MINILDEIAGAFGKGSPAVAAATPNQTPVWMSVYQGLQNRGMDPETAAAFTSNIGAESTFNPKAKNDLGALGYHQALYPTRKKLLMDNAAKAGSSWDDPEVQLDTIYQEYADNYNKIQDRLKGVTDPQERARIVRMHYEQPGTAEQDPSGYAATARYAAEIAGYKPPEDNENMLAAFARSADVRAGHIAKDGAGIDFGGASTTWGDMANAGMNPANPAQAEQALAYNTGKPGGPLSNAYQVAGSSAGGGDVVTSAKSPDVEEPAEQGFLGGLLTQLGGKLFPDEEDPEGRMREMIGGIGVGLSQMSHGQPVDMQPYFQNIQDQKQLIIDNQHRKERAALADEMAERGMLVQEGHLYNANAELALDAAVANQELQIGGGAFTKEQLMAIRDNPDTRHFFGQLSSPNPDIYEQGIKDYNQYMKDRLNARDATGNMGDLYSAFTDPNATQEQIVSALEGATPAALGQIADLPGIKQSNVGVAVDELMEAAKTDPSKFAMLEKMHRISNQMDPSHVPEARFDLGMEMLSTAAETATAAYKLSPTVQVIREATDAIISDVGDVDTSVMTRFIGTAQVAARALGVGGSWDEQFAKITGATAKQIERMSNAEKILMFEIGRQKLSKQGSTSDAERQMAADTIVNGNTSSEERLYALSTLDAANDLDVLMYAELVRAMGPDLADSVEARSYQVTTLAPMIVPMTEAFTNNDLLLRAEAMYNDGKTERNLHLKEYADISKALRTEPVGSEAHQSALDQFVRLRAPTFTPAQAQAGARMMKKRKITHYWDEAKQELVARPAIRQPN